MVSMDTISHSEFKVKLMISRDKMRLLEGARYETNLIHSHPISTQSNKMQISTKPFQIIHSMET
jgi:hypothetical protein